MFTLGEASFKLSTSRTLNLLFRSRFALNRILVREYFETRDDPKVTCHCWPPLKVRRNLRDFPAAPVTRPEDKIEFSQRNSAADPPTIKSNGTQLKPWQERAVAWDWPRLLSLHWSPTSAAAVPPDLQKLISILSRLMEDLQKLVFCRWEGGC